MSPIPLGPAVRRRRSPSTRPSSTGPRTWCGPRRRTTPWSCPRRAVTARPRRPRRGTARRGPPGRRRRPTAAATSTATAHRATARRWAGVGTHVPAGGRSMVTRPAAGRTVGGAGTEPSTSRDDGRAVDVVQPQLGADRDAVGQRGDPDGLDVLGQHEVAALDEGVGAGREQQRQRAARRRADQHLAVPSGRRGQLDAVAPDRGVDGHRLARLLEGEQAGGVGHRLDRLLLAPAVDASRQDVPLLVGGRVAEGRRAAGSGRAGPRATGTCPRTRPGWPWPARGTARRAGTSCPPP